MSAKKVFISYSHDSDEHRERVLSFSERLRADGIDTILDQYLNGSPQQGWPRWMLDQLDAADAVLVVCTPTYYRRFRGHEEPGKGKGVDWEGALITQELYDSRSRTLKFVPIFLADPVEAWIPESLRSVSYYVPTSESDYMRLCDFLLGQAGVEPQQLGRRRIKPRRRGTALTFSGPSSAENARGLISPQEFVDDRVREAAIALNQAREDKSLTMRTLIETLDRLFERDTFRREPSVGVCATQEWDYRLHGALQTLRLLEQYEPFVEAEARDLWPRYRKLTTEVSRYCQRMAAYLFEPAVGLSELRLSIGTVEFINKIRHKKKWFKRGVSPETCRRIDPHLKKALRQMGRLRDDVLLRLSK
jgi:SEFIR domain